MIRLIRFCIGFPLLYLSLLIMGKDNSLQFLSRMVSDDELVRALKTGAAIFLLCACSNAADVQYVSTLHDPAIPVYGTHVDETIPTFNTAVDDETVIVNVGGALTLSGRSESVMDLVIPPNSTLLLENADLRVRTLTGLGTLVVNGRCTITFRDGPFEAFDPLQYGCGLLVINGTLKVESADWRQVMVPLSGAVSAGDTAIALSTVPKDWRVGDRILLPGLKKPARVEELSADTEIAEIAAIEWPAIHLREPVQFDHAGEVGNLTQPVVFRSENPDGIRGHVFVTAGSHQDCEGIALVEMARTTTAKLDGNNQIGRYAWHHHHLLGRRNNGLDWQYRLEHVVVEGSPKWGIALHGSHFGLVNDCLAYDCAGCGIVTEDPWVYGNRITNNLIVPKRPGSGQRITDRATAKVASGDHWHDRGGLGLESAMNTITGNRVYCAKDCIGMAGSQSAMLYRPTEPGVCPVCDPKNREVLASHNGYTDEPKRYPFVFDTSGNTVTAGWRPIELWAIDTYEDYERGFDGLTIVNCAQPTDFEDQQETVIRGWKFSGGGAYDVDLKNGYRFGFTALDCEFGARTAYRLVNDGEYTRFVRCHFDCDWVVGMPRGRMVGYAGPWEGLWEDCTFADRTQFAWGDYPKYDLSLALQPGRTDSAALRPVRYFVRPWKDGRDYQVFHYEQHPDWKHRGGDPGPNVAYGDLPKGAWTQQQLIDRGTPIFGDSVPPEAERWGDFWAAPEDCCTVVERLRAENARLKAKLESKN